MLGYTFYDLHHMITSGESAMEPLAEKAGSKVICKPDSITIPLYFEPGQIKLGYPADSINENPAFTVTTLPTKRNGVELSGKSNGLN